MEVKTWTYPFFFDEIQKLCSLYLHWLPGAIVQCNDKMEEVTFAEITWWLFLEMSTSQPA